MIILYYLYHYFCNWHYFFVLSGNTHNFRKYDRSLIDSLGTPYDYRSVMHYSAKAFTKNGLPTLMVKQEGVLLHKTLACYYSYLL